MDKYVSQLERLLDFADLRVLRMLSASLWGSKQPLGRVRSLAETRNGLLRKIRRRGLVADALQRLAVETEKEFISHDLWQLNRLVGVGDAVLNHPHFLEGQRFINGNFDPGSATVCLFVPCHRVKPYSLSPTVSVVRSVLEEHKMSKDVAIVVASVPGMVPLGFDRYYPFAYYDWDPIRETEMILDSYRAAIWDRARKFIGNTKGRFSFYAAYFRPRSPELRPLLAAANDERVVMKVAPKEATVQRVVERNRALWRFGGLKNLECLNDLCQILNGAIIPRN